MTRQTPFFSIPPRAGLGRGLLSIAHMLLACLAVLSAASVTAHAQQGSEEPAAKGIRERVDETRSVMQTWYEVNEVFSKEENQWREEQQLLEDLVEIRRRELEAVRERKAEARKSTAEATARREELRSKRDTLTAAVGVLADSVAAMERRTRDLLVRLPDPLREQVRSNSQALPGPSTTDEQLANLTLSKRIINVLAILNEAHRFQREIKVVPDTRTLPNGDTAQVTALYLGIGQGYYVTAAGDNAAIGTSTEHGWLWMPATEHAKTIAKAIAIAKNEAPAEFVPLPVRVR